MTVTVSFPELGRTITLSLADGLLVSFVERGDGPDPTPYYRIVAEALEEAVHRIEGYTTDTRVKL